MWMTNDLLWCVSGTLIMILTFWKTTGVNNIPREWKITNVDNKIKWRTNWDIGFLRCFPWKQKQLDVEMVTFVSSSITPKQFYEQHQIKFILQWNIFVTFPELWQSNLWVISFSFGTLSYFLSLLWLNSYVWTWQPKAQYEAVLNSTY